MTNDEGIKHAEAVGLVEVLIADKINLQRRFDESEAANAVMRAALENIQAQRFYPSERIAKVISTNAGKPLLEERNRHKSALEKIASGINPLSSPFAMVKFLEDIAKQALKIPKPTETKDKL